MKYGDTITLLATVINNEENASGEEEDTQEITITITIVQTNEEDNDHNEQKDSLSSENNTDNQTETNINSVSMENESQTNTSSSDMTLSSMSSSTEESNDEGQTVTYNGSSNNYLSELSIDGYEFTNSFSKENTTYFVKVDSEVESLTVNYTKDDDDSTVCIYGNDDLDNNSNKILISVTAENGDVRTYRIIVIEEEQ